jgi:hypothetical protein
MKSKTPRCPLGFFLVRLLTNLGGTDRLEEDKERRQVMDSCIRIQVSEEVLVALVGHYGEKSSEEKLAATQALVSAGVSFPRAVRQVSKSTRAALTPAEVVQDLLGYLFSGAPASRATRRILAQEDRKSVV